MAFLHVLSSLVFSVLLIDSSTADKYYSVTLYEQFNSLGESVTFKTDSVADLNDELIQFDNQARSACLHGIWMLYNTANYNPDGCGDMEFMFSPNTSCYNFHSPTGVAGTLSSLRVAGNPMNYRLSTFSIYQHVNFQGSELLIGTSSVTSDLSQFGHVKRVIITGDDDWSVYDQPNFKGRRWCLRVPVPGSFKPAFFPDIEALNPKIPYNKVLSVRRGCM